MKRIILQSMIFLTLIAIGITSVLTLLAMYQVFNQNTRNELRLDASFMLRLLDEDYSLDQFVQSQAVQEANTRVTVIARDGKVVFDNWADAEDMDNHLQRAEVQKALENGAAESFRLSSTLGSQTFYYAVLLDDGTILRFAKTTESALFMLYRLLTLNGLIILGVILVAILVAGRIVKVVLKPINNLDLSKPLENDVYEELSPLLIRISRQNSKIKQQMQTLSRNKEEFDAITQNMAEGLIILDRSARIVWLNSSALGILGEGRDAAANFVGKSLSTLTRDINLQDSVQQGLLGEKSEIILSLGEKSYQVFSNPVREGVVIRGLVLLFVDITQKYEAEQLRKEFSGNVSHELKTPLTSILSYAELLKNEMVKPKDIQKFSKHIYDEAQRMVALIDDILKLSRLDEKIELDPKEDVELKALATSIANRLEPLASKKGVAVRVTGEPCFVFGDRAILFEMIYNLCDNAIKYSRTDEGEVNIHCATADGRVVLQVSDNGLGIPEQHQSRVFERFYRVDESHSKRTGGTGLGLSIVKHAARYHKAEVRLESVENKGTTISVIFKAKKFQT